MRLWPGSSFHFTSGDVSGGERGPGSPRVVFFTEGSEVKLQRSRVFAAHTPGVMSGFRADPATLGLISLHTGCFLLYAVTSALPDPGLAPQPSDFSIFILNVLVRTYLFRFPAAMNPSLPFVGFFLCLCF